MTGWYRLWIYNYGLLVKPLYALIMEENRDLQWTKEATLAFNQLKKAFMSAPALGLPDKFLKYQAIMVEQDDVEIVVTNLVNPASFLSESTREPVIHDCLETIEATYSSHPDLKDTPLEDTETCFTDGSSYVISRKRHTGKQKRGGIVVIVVVEEEEEARSESSAIEIDVPPSTPGSREPSRLYPPLPSSDSEWDEPEPPLPDPKPSPQGLVASRTRRQTKLGGPPPSPKLLPPRTRKQTKGVIQAPLRQAITADRETKIIKVPFFLMDLESWEKIAKTYWSDPIGVAKRLRFMVRQHVPDWADLQLLLDALTETEKQLVFKTAKDLAEDDCRTTLEDVKHVFPLHDPWWDPNEPM
ncbi:hypothetical protein HGM15179_019097 [Zosterops borbonicus]|uniref:Reverse transcriptase/retrotransposon-derived protein RNase H-like domain-containing protein n=1 Tax=Zosterops borbonicus TaxID=364589 RepID=A0A8K1D8Q4_9PASS|nr:hypothetical protein HGM15179_019097 [Zosterops borbonicus]